MKTTLSTRGQLVLPADLRREDDVRPGEEFEITRVERGEYLLRRVRRAPNAGLVKLLFDCPEKGWFEPLSRTESTDDVLPPRLS
jgi:AbrB family looped-hinge helix DNA binding protein